MIADRQWHFVAMVVDKNAVALYVDGKEAAKATVEKQVGGQVIPGKLSIGAVGPLGCDGVIDDLRISNIARDIRGIPNAPQTADAHTIGLWSFDYVAGAKNFADASTNANPVGYRLAQRTRPHQFQSGPVAVGFPGGSHRIAGREHRIAAQGGGQCRWTAIGNCSKAAAPEQRLSGDWSKAIAAPVPGSVHTALYRAGVIPFPYMGRNQEIAKDWSAKTYWYRKTFSRPPKGQDQTLVFHGVCNRCTIWLNGKELGKHEGMFTRIEFPIHDLLQDDNTLIVKLDPAIALAADRRLQQQLRLALFEVPAAGHLAIRGDSRQAGRRNAESLCRHARRQGRNRRSRRECRRAAKRLVGNACTGTFRRTISPGSPIILNPPSNPPRPTRICTFDSRCRTRNCGGRSIWASRISTS